MSQTLLANKTQEKVNKINANNINKQPSLMLTEKNAFYSNVKSVKLPQN
jgi:hypothetical protein